MKNNLKKCSGKIFLFFFVVSMVLFAGCSLNSTADPEQSGYSSDNVNDLKESEYVVSMRQGDQPDFLCDGTQDQIQINQAILAAAGNSNKRTVLLKSGTYYVDSSILMYNNVVLKGKGTSNTIIFLVDNAPSFVDCAGIIRIRTKSGRITNARIEDFTIDGNESHQESTDKKKYGIYAEGNNIIMRRITVRNCAGYGFDPHSAKSHTVPASNLVIENCISESNRTDGYTLDMVQDSFIISNIARYNGRHGFNLCTTAANDLLIGNQVLSNAINGIMIQNGSHTIRMLGNVISDNRETGVMIRHSHGCILNGNLIAGSRNYAVDARGAVGTTVVSNFLSNNGVSSPSRYAQVYFEDYNAVLSLSNEISWNAFFTSYGNARAAFEEEAGSDFNRVCSNTATGFSRPFVIRGTNTVFTGNTAVSN